MGKRQETHLKESEKVAGVAKENLEDGERWHKKVNARASKHRLILGIEMALVGTQATAIPYAIGELLLPTICHECWVEANVVNSLWSRAIVALGKIAGRRCYSAAQEVHF